VCRVVIPRTVRLSEAPSVGQPVTVYAPNSRGAVAYRELAREIHERGGQAEAAGARTAHDPGSNESREHEQAGPGGVWSISREGAPT